jgi:hypothetical protein
MKKSICLGLLVIASQCYGAVEKDKIEDAIQQSSLSKLKIFLGRADREEMAPDVRKKMYGRFLRAANEVTEGLEQNLSVINNSRDALRAGLGIVAAFFSTLFFMDARQTLTIRPNSIPHTQKTITITHKPMLISGILSAGLASYLLYRGLTCSTQKARIEEAKNIENLIKSKIHTGEESEQE